MRYMLLIVLIVVMISSAGKMSSASEKLRLVVYNTASSRMKPVDLNSLTKEQRSLAEGLEQKYNALGSDRLSFYSIEVRFDEDDDVRVFLWPNNDDQFGSNRILAEGNMSNRESLLDQIHDKCQLLKFINVLNNSSQVKRVPEAEVLEGDRVAEVWDFARELQRAKDTDGKPLFFDQDGSSAACIYDNASECDDQEELDGKRALQEEVRETAETADRYPGVSSCDDDGRPPQNLVDYRRYQEKLRRVRARECPGERQEPRAQPLGVNKR